MEVEEEVEMAMETEREREREGRKRVRAPSSKKEDPNLAPAVQERLACLVAESVQAWERRAAEAKGKPKVDHYAVQASQFPDDWNSLWFDYFSSFDDTRLFALHWQTSIHCKRANDPCLALTGPVRSVVLLDPVTFEVKLTVKGTTKSDDKDLSALAVPLMYTPDRSYLLNVDYTSKLSTVELRYGHLRYSVEASISVLVSSGASLGRVQFVASTGSIGEEKVVLLDSANGGVPVTGDGVIKLSRHVVSVEVYGKLKVSVMAWRQGDNKAVERWKDFIPKEADRSHGFLNFGFCRMKITVAWSLITVGHFCCDSSV
ncbi:hypothetical protein BAE44_0022104 [Dichanthelium oligosanthes]|uniref:DUF6598 domain-containing protein n=1 Tax=Dichanthelium oligosanthes TaxID=888268 RepID=A0A1E5UVH5_9POAL|nr:hypothetical protein BAE44_0022104 [Dichanthelium oligosanthes]